LAKDRKNATQKMTATYATVTSLTRRMEGIGHKLYTDIFFSSPDLLNDLHKRGINSYWTVTQICKGMARSFDNKTLKLKWGDTHAMVRGKLTVMIWTEK
jgi:hypothetical protein